MVEDPEVGVEAGLEKGIREFNDEAFFECHDTLEAVWMEVRGRERLFFQGLVQLAIGYYHLACENYVGADHLLGRGIQKLEEFLPCLRGIDLADLVGRASRTRAEIRAGRLETHNPAMIPKIRRVETINGPQ